MVAFRKKILRPGVYNVKTPDGRKIDTFTRERINKIVATNNSMLSSGLKIPAPYAHKDGNNVVPMPLMENEKASWNSGINAGYWTKFEVDSEDNSLVGILEVPGDVSDTNSPAGKVGTTVTETSIYLQPEFTDGLSRSWEEALFHVALVDGKSVEPGQSNFEQMPTEASYMCVSMADEINSDSQQNKTSGGVSDNKGETPASSETSPNDGSDVVATVIDLIREKLGMDMPEDTDASNFMDRLLTILTSKKSEGEEDENQQPEGSDIPSSPVAMADSPNNPDNVVVVEDKKAASLLNYLIKTTKESLLAKMESLVAAGKLGRSHADKLIKPQIDAIAMSLSDLDDEGNIPQTPVAMSLDLIEDVNTALTEDNSSETAPAAGTVVSPPVSPGEEELSREQVSAVLDDLDTGY